MSAPESAAGTAPDAARVRPLSPHRVGALSEDVRLACMRISRRVRFESADSIAPHQFSVLARLEDGPRTPRDLAGIEKVSAPSMTRTVGGLVEDGLVARSEHPDDGRQVLVSLTDQGRDTLRTARRARGAWMESRVAALSPAEQRDLVRAAEILGRLAAQ